MQATTAGGRCQVVLSCFRKMIKEFNILGRSCESFCTYAIICLSRQKRLLATQAYYIMKYYKKGKVWGMNFTKEQKEKFENAKTLEEKKQILSELGLTLSDEELSNVAGGFLSHEGKHCHTTPDTFCTGVLWGIDACKYYVEEHDPNSMATAWTYPVLCTCERGHFKNFPMNRRYQE